MNGSAAPSEQPSEYGLDAAVAQRYLTFSSGFWAGETRVRAWALTLGLVAALLASTYATIQLTHWSRWFFDALERRDLATVQSAVLVFLVIVAAMAAVGVAVVLARETLQVRWRAWLVEHLICLWLSDTRYYRLAAAGIEPQNPEYRISDDTRWATEILVDLGIGLLTALVGGVAFITILWTVGGAISFAGISIPGYLVWLALAYGMLASLAMAWIGRPLVGRVGAKNEAEGHFRFAMMRLRDNAESVALMQGGSAERTIIGRAYERVVERWLAIVRSHGRLTWVTNASGPMIPIVPLLFAAPKYLAGEMTLGQVTQVAAAFVQVQIAISWVVDNFNRIAEWYASARRIVDLLDANETLAPLLPPHGSGQGPVLVLDEAGVTGPDGRTLIAPGSLAISAGEAVYVLGASSSGKSTLTRIVAGILPPSVGTVSRRQGASVALVPQRTYVPLGTLATVLAYPAAPETLARTRIEAALEQVGLDHLAAALDEDHRWAQLLSAGEHQRLAIARVILRRPDLVVLDDALSALEQDREAALIATLRRALPDAALLVLSQRPPADAEDFDRIFRLAARGNGAAHLEPVDRSPARQTAEPTPA